MSDPMCSVCKVAPARRRGACWGCYKKYQRAGLLDAVDAALVPILAPRADNVTRFGPASPIAAALHALVERLSPDARAALHEATRPQNDAPPATPGRVVRHG